MTGITRLVEHKTFAPWEDENVMENEIKEDSWLVTDIDQNIVIQDINNASWTDFVKKAGNNG